nr:HD domain-containing protein [Actinomycetota bacterium]
MSYVVVMGDDPAGRDLVATSLRDAGYPIVLAHLDEPPSALLADEGIELAVCRADSPGSPALSLLETVRRLRPGLPAVLVTHALTELDVSGSPPPELVSEPFAPEELARAAARALGRLVQEAPPGHADTTLVGLLANAIETRKPTSNGHSERLASIAVDLAEALGLRDAAVATVRTGAMLHDVGYIGIPEQILLKPGALEPEEGAVMRTHTVVGDQLLAPLAELAAARPIVRSHHERWDGHGYPDGLAGESIPLAARIVAVADGIEAMSAHRSYRTTLTPREIVRE